MAGAWQQSMTCTLRVRNRGNTGKWLKVCNLFSLTPVFHTLVIFLSPHSVFQMNLSEVELSFHQLYLFPQLNHNNSHTHTHSTKTPNWLRVSKNVSMSAKHHLSTLCQHVQRWLPVDHTNSHENVDQFTGHSSACLTCLLYMHMNRKKRLIHIYLFEPWQMGKIPKEWVKQVA